MKRSDGMTGKLERNLDKLAPMWLAALALA